MHGMRTRGNNRARNMHWASMCACARLRLSSHEAPCHSPSSNAHAPASCLRCMSTAWRISTAVEGSPPGPAPAPGPRVGSLPVSVVHQNVHAAGLGGAVEGTTRQWLTTCVLSMTGQLSK